MLISELSGRGNIMSKVEELGMLGQKPGAHADTGGASKTPEWKERSAAILSTVKDLEQKVPPRARAAPRRRSVRDRPGPLGAHDTPMIHPPDPGLCTVT